MAEYGAFGDMMLICGTIQSFNSVFPDAVDGRRDGRIVVEEGCFVQAAQALLHFDGGQDAVGIMESIEFTG